MPFNRSNSKYHCPPDCPDRSPICHTRESNCRIYSEDHARAEAAKAAANRQMKADGNVKAVLIESRQHFKRVMKISE